MKKPSVVFFNRVYPPVRGATGRVLRDLARAMVRDGWNVTILTTGAVTRTERDGDIRIVRVRAPMKAKNIFTYAYVWGRMMAAAAKLPRHDLLVTMTDPPMVVVAGRMIARWRKCAHLHWCQDLYPDLLPTLGIRLPDFIQNALTTLSRRSMKSCDKVIVIGRCMAKHLTKSGMDPKRVAVIPNWPDYELVHGGMRGGFNAARPATSRSERTAQAAAKPFEDLFRDGDMPKFRVLYAGTMGRAHPLHTILDAAGMLNHRYPEIEFVFVGDGPGLDRLAHERARRGLENIRLLPWQPASRLRELMESGDVHLVSMRHDSAGFLVPCKLYSALAVGRPCVFVGPAHSEVAKIITDFHAGAVVSQGEPETLAQTILALRMNGDLWHTAHDGAAQAGRIFVPEESINAWIKRARDVIGQPKRTAPPSRNSGGPGVDPSIPDTMVRAAE